MDSTGFFMCPYIACGARPSRESPRLTLPVVSASDTCVRTGKTTPRTLPGHRSPCRRRGGHHRHIVAGLGQGPFYDCGVDLVWVGFFYAANCTGHLDGVSASCNTAGERSPLQPKRSSRPKKNRYVPRLMQINWCPPINVPRLIRSVSVPGFFRSKPFQQPCWRSKQ